MLTNLFIFSNRRHGDIIEEDDDFFSEFDNDNDENLGFINEMMNMKF